MNTPEKGLVTDYSNDNQPKGTYPFALNAVAESVDGDLGWLITELGNTDIINFPDDLSIIGAIKGEVNEVYVFLTDNNISEIGKITDKEQYETIIRATCLNFNLNYQIKGQYKNRNDCEKVIVFHDENNPPRYIDVLNLDAYKTDGNWDCDKMRFFSAFTQPYASNIQVNNNGGTIPLGTLQFTFQYSDGIQSTTPFSTPTNVIPITNEPITNWRNIDGGKFTQEGFTTKSVTLTIDNLDRAFDFLNIIAIEQREGVRTAYLVDTVQINQDTLNYTYTGLDYDVAELIQLSELSQVIPIYDRVRESAIINKRLLFMGLTEKEVPHSELQQAANGIQTSYVTKATKYQNMADANSRSPQNYIQLQSHMRDEVIALGIRYIYDDGYVTPTYHIPGREKDKYSTGQTIPLAEGNANSHSRPAASTNWDSDDINSATYPEEVKHILACSDINTSTPSGSCADLSYTIEFDNRTSPLTINYNFGLAGSGFITITYKDTLGNTLGQDGESVGQTGSFDIYGTPSIPYIAEVSFTYTVGSCEYEDSTQFDGVLVALQNYSNTVTTTSVGGTIYQRWQVFNTAIRQELNSVTSPYYTKGELGYYETCEISYPDDVDCTGNRIYPEGKIRHHRLPDTTLEENFVNDDELYTIQLGLEFNNITYPDPNIVGHEFMMATIDDSNRTVIDKGIFYFNILDSINDQTVQSHGGSWGYDSAYFGNTVTFTKTQLSFHSPITKFEGTQLAADYIKLERYYSGPTDNYAVSRDVIRYNSSSIPTNTNRLITAQAYIQPNTELSGTFVRTFQNLPLLETFVIEFDDDIDDPTGWIPSTSVVAPATDYCIYGSLKKYVPNAYSDLNALKYRPLYHIPNTNIVFGGDSFISRLAFRKTYDDPTSGGAAAVPWFFCESRINADMRHSEDGASLPTQYFPKHFDTDAEILSFLEQTNEVPNHYRYNRDFSNINDVIPSFPLSRTFDWCADCTKNFPYRVAWSEEDLQETYDSNRTFRVNNYKDLPTNGGVIRSAFVHNYQLYIRTVESLWIQPTSAEQLITNNSLIYLGTGEFLEQDARELVSSENASIGGYTRYTNLRNEVGTLLINDIKGDIYIFGDKLGNITAGNRNFFKNHLPVKLYDQFYNLTNTEFPKDNPANHVGVIAAYDDRHARFIITKQDYRIIEDQFFGLLSDADSSAIGKLVWNETNKVFQKVTSYNPSTLVVGLENVPYTDTQFFENLSFTVSYSTTENKWVSFHSYLPKFYISLPNKFYSFIQDGSVWKHNTGNFQTFYDSTKPFIVHQVYNEGPTQDKVMNAMDYLTEVYEYDIQEKQWKEKHYETFDEVIFWGTRQTSGLQNIIVLDTQGPFASLNYAANEIYAERDGKLWNLTGIKNLRAAGDIALFTKDWDDTTYRAAYPIDKVPNVDAYDYTMSQFDMSSIKDRFLNIRFYYYNDSNRKLVFKLTDTKVIPNVT